MPNFSNYDSDRARFVVGGAPPRIAVLFAELQETFAALSPEAEPGEVFAIELPGEPDETEALYDISYTGPLSVVTRVAQIYSLLRA